MEVVCLTQHLSLVSIVLTLKLPGEGQMALPLNFSDKEYTQGWFFLGILNLYIFSMIQCEWIATENICKKFYGLKEKENKIWFWTLI